MYTRLRVGTVAKKRSKHTPDEYDKAMTEPVVLHPPVSANWKAPQFVWQVRRELAQILCPDTLDDCQKVDVGGYRVITSLDWNMQKIAEKWVYVAARAPNSRDPQAILASRKIPAADRGWILALRGHNINNAAGAVIDYRTGEVLAYVGSASYTSKGNPKFQPQFDVLADGWRQPGSAIKPVDYLIGIDDKTLTASTMLMDVTTNFGNNFIPIQADKAERGPVRLRSALQFSLNIPAIKATIMTGLDHTFDRTKDLGLTYQSTASPVLSMGIGTIEVHPIDLLGAYGTIANNGVHMPRQFIKAIIDNGTTVWPQKPAVGQRVTSAGAAYIITDILAGNTDVSVNPFWGKWAIFDGRNRRPAAYKTGTTSNNVDVAAYGFVAPPKDKKAPALAVGVWMGNSDNTPNDGKLSLDTSAPLWSAILREVSKGEPIVQFKPPKGLVTADVDAFTGLKPGPFTTKKIKELFLPDTVPTQKETLRVTASIDAATGLLWRDGCARARGHQGLLQPVEVEANFPAGRQTSPGAPARRPWGPVARRGGGPTTSTRRLPPLPVGERGAVHAAYAVSALHAARLLRPVPDADAGRVSAARTTVHPVPDVRPLGRAVQAHAKADADQALTDDGRTGRASWARAVPRARGSSRRRRLRRAGRGAPNAPAGGPPPSPGPHPGARPSRGHG
jgi:penicillin-binding protein 1A